MQVLQDCNIFVRSVTLTAGSLLGRKTLFGVAIFEVTGQKWNFSDTEVDQNPKFVDLVVVYCLPLIE